MTAAPQTNRTTAFSSTHSARRVSSLPASAPYTSPAPSRPAPPPAAPAQAPARSRPSVQTAPLYLMLLTAVFVLAMGLVYLSGHARLTYEGYRRVKLQSALRRERELATRYLAIKTQVAAPAAIEQRAVAAGMVRAADSETVTVK